MPNPLDITVLGQRRINSTMSFPGRFDPPPGDVPETVPDQGDPDYVPPADRCADPAHRTDFKADARVAWLAKEFERLAKAMTPPETINDREWGAYLYVDAIGEVQVGPISHGDPFVNGGNGTVDLIEAGIDPASIIGSVHTHSVGNHLPSTGSDSDMTHLAGLIAYSGNANARLYIIAKNLVQYQQTQFNQINVYNSSNAQAAVNSNTPGPEVNPDAESCPL